MAKRNKQGFQPIGEKQIGELIKLVEKASEPFLGVQLDKPARRRIVKMRKGGQAAIPTIVAMCQRHGLSVHGVSFDDLSSKAIHIARLQELERAASVFLQALRDEVLVVQADAWTGTSAAYSMLKGAARSQRDIRKELENVHAFFAVRRGKKAASASSKAPPVSPPVTEPTPKETTAPAATA